MSQGARAKGAATPSLTRAPDFPAAGVGAPGSRLTIPQTLPVTGGGPALPLPSPSNEFLVFAKVSGGASVLVPFLL